MLTRRFFLAGLVASPLVVQADRLMPLRGTPYDPWVQVQSWPLGMPQPMDTVISRAGNTTIGSFGGIMRMSTFGLKRMDWERDYGRLNWDFCAAPAPIPKPHPSRNPFEIAQVRETLALQEWKRRGHFVHCIPTLPRDLEDLSHASAYAT